MPSGFKDELKILLLPVALEQCSSFPDTSILELHKIFISLESAVVCLVAFKPKSLTVGFASCSLPEERTKNRKLDQLQQLVVETSQLGRPDSVACSMQIT